jgi:glutamate dehydrogenase/leucine dehydrogenase
VQELKNVKRGRISEYADKYGVDYHTGKRPWSVPCDLAFPCATQNEINGNDAEMLVKNGCIAIAEGANIHEKCVRYGKEGDYVNYPKGANIAGFIKVADAMLSLGIM